jgi:hypothetical protein
MFINNGINGTPMKDKTPSSITRREALRMGTGSE